MYLVDTSVWVNLYRGLQTPATETLKIILQNDRPYSVAGVIIQEILQGAKNKKDYVKLKRYFSTQRICHPGDPVETYIEAAQLYYECRRKGVTIRSTIDCLIARLAIENQLILLHDDHDFIELTKADAKLVLYDNEWNL